MHNRSFPTPATVPPTSASDANLVGLCDRQKRLTRHRTVYTEFEPALVRITTPEAGSIETFIDHLQEKLDEKLDNGNSPDAPTLLDLL